MLKGVEVIDVVEVPSLADVVGRRAGEDEVAIGGERLRLVAMQAACRGRDGRFVQVIDVLDDEGARDGSDSSDNGGKAALEREGTRRHLVALRVEVETETAESSL